MDTWIYCASLYCEECAAEIRSDLVGVSRADMGDSDSYPQGPYPNGGGEADCPQHCDSCGIFLENPLTPDGVEYVKEAEPGRVRQIWRDFYGF